jgi:hypothetical protein
VILRIEAMQGAELYRRYPFMLAEDAAKMGMGLEPAGERNLQEGGGNVRIGQEPTGNADASFHHVIMESDAEVLVKDTAKMLAADSKMSGNCFGSEIIVKVGGDVGGNLVGHVVFLRLSCGSGGLYRQPGGVGEKLIRLRKNEFLPPTGLLLCLAGNTGYNASDQAAGIGIQIDATWLLEGRLLQHCAKSLSQWQVVVRGRCNTQDATPVATRGVSLKLMERVLGDEDECSRANRKILPSCAERASALAGKIEFESGLAMLSSLIERLKVESVYSARLQQTGKRLVPEREGHSNMLSDWIGFASNNLEAGHRSGDQPWVDFQKEDWPPIEYRCRVGQTS